ncbi:MAG: helix-turn-helix transcriptional regulator [Kofleriaceae bacterium]|nr:helix-turn-helix transcriptional regulator [Kofleriaceae bacterium]
MVRNTARTAQARLGARIHDLRRERALTQEALALRCGISQKYLSELERGEKTPSWETLVALAHRGFGIRMATLLFGIDEDPDNELRSLDELLAGRPQEVRYDVLRAVRLILRAGEGSKPGR